MSTRKLSFTKRSLTNQLELARNKLQELCDDPLDEPLADSCAEELNKCVDYLHRAGKCGCGGVNLKNCRKTMRSQCQAIGIIEDVADSVKHDGINRSHVTIQDSRTHGGAFSSGFSRGFDVSRLVIDLEDGSTGIDFIDSAKEALVYLEEKGCT